MSSEIHSFQRAPSINTIIPGYASHGMIKADQELPTGEECQRRASEEIKAIDEKEITL